MAARARPPGAAARSSTPSRRFLASRANEQIYNNASERTKVIYALHYAGLIPAGPGKSHQSLRDISLLGCAAELRRRAARPTRKRRGRCRLGRRGGGGERRDQARDRAVAAPDRAASAATAQPGRGTVLREGDDAVLFAYGPVMLHEALTRGRGARARSRAAVVDHAVAEPLRRATGLPSRSSRTRTSSSSRTTRRSARSATRCGGSSHGPLRSRSFGVEGWPACGTPPEALRFHGLDGASLADRIGERSARTAPRREQPVWLVLPDPLSTRIFFDTGIVDGLRARLGDRLELFLLDTGEQADAWAQRAGDMRTTTADDLKPLALSSPESGSTCRRLARSQDRLLSALLAAQHP